MATSLLSLPNELQICIADYLRWTCDHDSICNLAQSCRFFLHLLAPYLFEKVILTEEATNARSVLTLMNGPRAKFVSTLVFRPDYAESMLLFDDKINETHDPEIFLCDDSKTVLSNLSRFGSLNVFEFDLDCWADPDGTYQFFYGEGLESAITAEEQEPYRLLLRNAFKSLAANGDSSPSSTLQEPRFRNLIPKPVSTFELGRGLEHFLTPIVRFAITLPEYQWEGANQLNRMDGYHEYISSIPRYFLRHLANLETLEIIADEDGCIGADNDQYGDEPRSTIELAMLPGHAPLRSITLTNYILDDHLINFIVKFTDTIANINLTECYGNEVLETSVDGTTQGRKWATLFEAIVDSRPPKLCSFQIELQPLDYEFDSFPCRLDADSLEALATQMEDGETNFDGADEFSATKEDILRAAQLVRRGRRSFRYAHILVKYGFLFVDRNFDHWIQHLIEGKEWAAWTKVQQLLEENHKIA